MRELAPSRRVPSLTLTTERGFQFKEHQDRMHPPAARLTANEVRAPPSTSTGAGVHSGEQGRLSSQTPTSQTPRGVSTARSSPPRHKQQSTFNHLPRVPCTDTPFLTSFFSDQVPAALRLASELERAGRTDEACSVLAKALVAAPSMHDVRRRIQKLVQERNAPRDAPPAVKPFQAKHMALVGPKGSRPSPPQTLFVEG